MYEPNQVDWVNIYYCIIFVGKIKVTGVMCLIASVVCNKLLFLARQHARTPHVARWQLVGYSVCVGKAEQTDFLKGLLFLGGGASKPHRSKYILVGSSFQQLPRL
jgi:hypothetical protein